MVLALATAGALAVPSSAADGRPQGGMAGVAAWVAPTVDTTALAAEDEIRALELRAPHRVGLPQATDLCPTTAGTWEDLPAGGGRWRLGVRSPGALWIMLGFDEYRLQRGAELRLYDAAGRSVGGPFTADDVRSHGELWPAPIAGDAVVVELAWPAELRGERPALHLGTVSHGYRPWAGVDESEPLGAGDCHVGVNCPLGDDWQYQKRGVVRLLIGGTGELCSGSLINNTKLDCKPYVLTADHCFSAPGANPASTVFLFGYELPACEPGNVPQEKTLSGATSKASHPATDHRLLEMSSTPPAAWNLFWNGWSRSPAPATESWIIHHPMGEVKKITHDANALVDGIDQGTDHWRVNQWEQGSTDPGSSGGPLFDQNRRIVGELHVDTASCANPTGYAEFGKFDQAWSNGLSQFLDPPPATNATVLDGMDQSFCGAPAPRLLLAGHVVDDSLGFTNGHADPGESFKLEVTLSNDGSLKATGVIGTLGTSHPLVSVTTPNASWADVAPFQTVSSNAPHFGVTVAPTFPCGASLPLLLSLSSAQGSWQIPLLLETGLAVGTEAPPPFADAMESGLNGWTTQNLIGSNPWSQVTTQSSSPTHSWFVADVTGVRDSVLIMPVVASVPPQATLRFAHLMNSEAGDGGVLEYTIDSFTWLDAGGLIGDGKYNSVIPTAFSSPIGGRKAWAGNLGGWRTVVVDLSTLEGQQVKLRWRFASDSFSGATGWYVDDVVLDTPLFQCVTCTDLDNDGVCPAPAGDDCADDNVAIYPGAPQVCDGFNNDCDDPGWPTLPAHEVDVDGDGLSACAGDCNGSDSLVAPGAAEVCDGQDNDCDGLLDESAACDTSCDAAERSGAEWFVDQHPSTSVQPVVVWNGAGWAIVWADARDGNLELYFSLLDPYGQSIVSQKRLTNAVADSFRPSLVWTGSEYGVSWCDARAVPTEVYFARLDGSGQVVGGEVVLGSCLTDGNSWLAWNGSGYAVAWVDAASAIRFRRLDSGGTPQGPVVELAGPAPLPRSPFLVWTGAEYGVAWQARDAFNQTQIFFTRVSGAGLELGTETPLTTTSVQSRQPALVWNGAGYGVTYNEGTGASRFILLARLDGTGALLGSPLQVSDSQTAGPERPAIEWTGGEYGLAWRDSRDGNGEVYFARVTPAGAEIASEIRFTNNPATSEAGAIAWNGTEHGIVWSESPAIRFARLGCNCFDTDGDGPTSCNDNCPELYNPGQSDIDLDFEGDACDLDDGMIYVTFATKPEVDWQAEQGFQSWNLYKGDLDVLRASLVYTQAPGSNALAARQCGLAVPFAADPSPPASGKTAYFLVTGVDGGVEGDLGQDSSGGARPNANPCP